MGALVSLHRGWGLPVRVLFDADQGGRDGKKRLVKEFSLSETEIYGLGDVLNVKRMEDVFNAYEKTRLGGGSTPNKSNIMRRMQELLASEGKWDFDAETVGNMQQMICNLQAISPEAFAK